MKGEKDNPKINAILLVKGGLDDTDYESFKGQLEELERQTLEKERVNYLIIKLLNEQKIKINSYKNKNYLK